MAVFQNQGRYGEGRGRYGRQTYGVDLVLCIDATGSMESYTGNQDRLINVIKENALHLYDDIARKMEEKNKQIEKFRVSVIVFRDYLADGEYAMQVSRTFELPGENEDLATLIHSIHAEGGGDEPENGLEALAYAIQSPWSNDCDRNRQVIVLWTDASAHNLGHGSSEPYYPREGMARDMTELSDWWNDKSLIDQEGKRLVLFAPQIGHWKYIAENWEQTEAYATSPGAGLAEKEYSSIINAITNSITKPPARK